MTTHTCSVRVSAAYCHPSTITYSHHCEKRNSVSSTSEVSLTSLERMCWSWWRGGCWEKSGGVMCGWMEIISDTTRCRAAISKMVARQQHLSESFFFFWVVTGLPHLTMIPFRLQWPHPPPPPPSSVLLANLYQLWPGACVPSSLAGIERLHQFIQQSPDAVVLLRGAGYGFVAHWADAAHLKPLYQAPVKTNMGRRGMKRLKTNKFHWSKKS